MHLEVIQGLTAFICAPNVLPSGRKDPQVPFCVIYGLFAATCYRWDGTCLCQSSHSKQWKEKSN
jgi:hypothetical protein